MTRKLLLCKVYSVKILRSSQTFSSKTKDKDLEILFKDKNQVDGKIVPGLCGGILSIHSSLVC